MPSSVEVESHRQLRCALGACIVHDMTSPLIDDARAREIAVLASVDPRTVRRELREPGSVRGLPGHRIRRALVEFGVVVTPLGIPGSRGPWM